MLDYNEITQKKYIVLDGHIYEVLDSHVFRKQQRKPVNQTKLRHVMTGKVTERSFHQSETVEEADIDIERATYIYSRNDESWFAKAGDKSARFPIPTERIGAGAAFLVEGMEIDVYLSDDDDTPIAERVLDVRLPIKVTLTVTEAPPGVRGNTAQGGTKHATLASGAVVSVPLFINEGDAVVVNTETGEYVERSKE